jgi:hypothetical protein
MNQLIVGVYENKAEPLTAPKTYAGEIKAFANSRSLRETYFHFANA